MLGGRCCWEAGAAGRQMMLGGNDAGRQVMLGGSDAGRQVMLGGK